MHRALPPAMLFCAVALSGCPVVDDGGPCIPAENAEAPGTLQESCTAEADEPAVLDSCGDLVLQCSTGEVCFTFDVAFASAGIRDAACGVPGQADARCSSEESDFPPCAAGLRCEATGENDVSTCVP